MDTPLGCRRSSLYAFASALLLLAALWLVLPTAALADGPCYARVGASTPYTSTDASAVQQAVDAAVNGDTVRVAGYCQGVHAYTDPTAGALDVTVLITKTLTLQGGYTVTNDWAGSDPDLYPTTLDAGHAGLVVYSIDVGDRLTLAGLNVVNGSYGGAASLAGGVTAVGPITLTGVSLLDNAGVEGGGLLGRDHVMVVDSLFQNNRSDYGGGLEVWDDHFPYENTLTVTGTRFISNSAGFDGGGCAAYCDGGRIVNSLFADNAAGSIDTPGAGAELYLSVMGNMDLLFSTMVHSASDPSSPEGSAIYLIGSTAHITDNIVANLSASGGYTTPINVGSASGPAAEDYNLFFNSGTPVGLVTSGSHHVTGDPAFVDPAGGDYHLSSTSAAIDAGADLDVSTDLDGAPRPRGGGFDLGAYESPFGMAVAVYKSAAPDPVQGSINTPGTLTYTLRVTNTGTVTLTATVTDTLPPQVTPTGTLVWTPTITPGGIWITACVVTVQSGYSGTLTNVLEATTLEGAMGAYTATSQAQYTPPTLALSKSVDPDPVQAGQTLTYTIRLTNTGAVTLTTHITDTLPAEVTPTGMLVWTPTITPGSVWITGVVVTVQAGYSGPLTNVVLVTTLEGATGIYTTTTLAQVTPALELSKSVDPDPVQAGQTLTYTIRLTNTGNVTLTASITDTLPAEVTPTGMLVWTPTITPGGVWITACVATVQTGYAGPLTNIVRATTLEGASGIYTATTTSVSCPALAVINVNRFDDVYRGPTLCSQCEGVGINTHGDCSLREAIERANLSAPQAVTIYLEAGTYLLSLPEPADGGNSGGDLNVTGNVTILGGQ